MSQPTVCCVMLVNGREAMVRRAVRSFQVQTYPVALRRLLVLDTGAPALPSDVFAGEYRFECCRPRDPIEHTRSIGVLRNLANAAASEEIILHWDSDDWSHPNRISEQVALLQASGKQCVGYREMLFWRTPRCLLYPPSQTTGATSMIANDLGEAWLYRDVRQNYCIGTSLCYWREAWEQKPFADLPRPQGGTGEDTEWLRGIDSLAVSSLEPKDRSLGPNRGYGPGPRMIASVHGKNTNIRHYTECMDGRPSSFKRAAEWDEHCREVMAL